MSTGTVTTTKQPDVGTLMARVADQKLSTGERLNSVGDVMRACAPKMFAALPKHVTADRMIRVAMNCIRKTPRLLECTPASLFSAITEAATYGWELGGVLGHAYLVPYGDECTLIPGYKGLTDLCRRSGQISTISLEVVHQGDEFAYQLGDNPFIKHVPDDKSTDRDRKPITHVYAVVVLRDGGVQRSVWSRQKIDAHKEQYSKAWKWAESGDPKKGGSKKDSAWHTAWPTMGKKTVLRDMINRGLVPMSAEYRQVAERAMVHEEEPLDFSGFSPMDTIDHVPTPRIENESEQDAVSVVEQFVISTELRFAEFTPESQKSDVVRLFDDSAGPESPHELSPEQARRLEVARDKALAVIAGNRGAASNAKGSKQKSMPGVS